MRHGLRLSFRCPSASPSRGRAFFASWLAALAIVASCTAAVDVRADEADIVAAARESYDRGAAAYDARDWARAAPAFARADELSPNLSVMELALTASLRADDAVTAMTVVERAQRRLGEASPLQAALKAARERFSGRVGHITVLCPAPLFCSATVDGALTPVGVARYATVGNHVVELTADGNPERHLIQVGTGASVEVRPNALAQAPPPAAPIGGPKPSPVVAPSKIATVAPPPAQPSGISPGWFLLGATATLALGAVTVGSGLDTRQKHQAFLAHPTDDQGSAGMAAQTRTNVLVGLTVASALTTGLLGLIAVNWSRDGAGRRATGSIDMHLGVSGAGVALSGHYR